MEGMRLAGEVAAPAAVDCRATRLARLALVSKLDLAGACSSGG